MLFHEGTICYIPFLFPDSKNIVSFYGLYGLFVTKKDIKTKESTV